MKRTLLLLLFSYAAWGQNLVSNSDFEQVDGSYVRRKGHLPISTCKGWFSSNMMATDYFNSILGKDAVPKNELGNQEPHSGNAYAGICIDKEYIEYLQTKLLHQLQEGKSYLIEFYISRAEKSKASLKEFGILFSDKANRAISGTGVTTEPSVKFINPKGYKDKKHWTKLSAVYEAQGFETYFILGHFTYDNPKYSKGYCHYYIDDVSITPIEKENDSKIETETKDSIPVTKIKINDSIPPVFLPKIGETITLKNIFFATNKSELLPESFLELDKLVQYLIQTPKTFIKISGHTDRTGNEDQNKILSEARAKAVGEYLTLKGIDKSRINYIGYGSSKPIATNDTDEGKQQNRRVEFIITKK